MIEKNKMKAVITGDIIGSSKLLGNHRDMLNQNLKVLIDELKEDGKPFSIYRGDSIQGIIDKPAEALQTAIMIKANLKSIHNIDNYLKSGNRSNQYRTRRPFVDIRLSIGIGKVDYQQENIQESDGQAFRYSGRTLDEMKERKRTIALTTSDKAINETWEVILSLLDQLMDKWTISSAELIYALLKDEKEIEISERLGISQPAVNHRKRYASWDAIKAMLSLYQSQIKRIHG